MSRWRLVLLSVWLMLAHVDHPRARPIAHAQAERTAREITIVVEHGAYHPSRIALQAGERVRLRFLRKEHSPCTREVVFPKLDIKRELPPNVPVLIDLPPLAKGSYAFHCAMNMVRGELVVSAAPNAPPAS